MRTPRDVRSRRVARLALLWLCATGVALAQSSGGSFRIEPQRIGNGGGLSSGGDFEVRGTIAQPEASPVVSGGAFELTGGFHRRAENAPLPAAIFADGFEGAP